MLPVVEDEAAREIACGFGFDVIAKVLRLAETPD